MNESAKKTKKRRKYFFFRQFVKVLRSRMTDMSVPLVIINDELHVDNHPFVLRSKCQLCGREFSSHCCDLYLSNLTTEYLEQTIVKYMQSIERLNRELIQRNLIENTTNELQ